MRRSTSTLLAIVLAQLVSCAHRPALVLAPAARVAGEVAHASIARVALAFVVLGLTLVAWLVPLGALLARAHDHRLGVRLPGRPRARLHRR